MVGTYHASAQTFGTRVKREDASWSGAFFPHSSARYGLTGERDPLEGRTP
jgi:hypothetical protein